jgi:hypothetical protein
MPEQGKFERLAARTCRTLLKPLILFYRLLEQAMAVGPVPYAAMVKGVRGLRKKRHHNE